MQILKELDKFDKNSNKFQLVDSENQHSTLVSSGQHMKNDWDFSSLYNNFCLFIFKSKCNMQSLQNNMQVFKACWSFS